MGTPTQYRAVLMFVRDLEAAGYAEKNVNEMMGDSE
jgi:hypothetical protein